MRNTFFLLAPFLLASRGALGAETGNDLPLRDVALFSSGVGYFGRAGQIEGRADVPLVVRAPQIADLLKSLVLFDAKGGVRPVTYGLQDYVATRPQETNLVLSSAASPGALLQAFQGARVQLEKPTGRVEGLILSVSSRQVKVDDTLVGVEFLSLLTDAGVQTVRLDDVQSFRLLDPKLDAKLRASLEQRARALTQKLDDGARPVMLHFEGAGKREVRAAYLLETPAWKTSYRLVLDAKKKPYLQGWAVVENTTDEDWNGVRLSLISGRPISFIQDLATPVYVARPVVAPQIIGSARPQTFGEGFSASEQRISALEARSMNGPSNGLPIAAPPRLALSPSVQHRSDYANYVSNTEDLRAAAARAGAGPGAGLPDGAPSGKPAGAKDDWREEGAASLAQGGERGELFEYAIAGATTIARGQAAMVPIVASDIGGDAVSIVDSSLQAGEIFASNGFLLRNSSGLHLQGGPITVFAGGTYAGDALVSNLSPNDARLIAYARDLELVAAQNAPQQSNNVTRLFLRDGVLHIKRSAVKTRRWEFKNKGAAPKDVLLQVPEESGWTLSQPKQPSEKTPGALRFRLTLAPGSGQFTAKWTRQDEETYGIFDLSSDDLVAYLSEDAISPALKARLSGVVAARNRLAALQRQRATQEATVRDIEADQARIRANMQPLIKTSPLFKSYEAKLSAQESRIERARAEVSRLREAENSARASLKSSLDGLDVD